MKKWEYRNFAFAAPGPAFKARAFPDSEALAWLAGHLAEIGEQGWEAVTITFGEGSDKVTRVSIWTKRESQEGRAACSCA